MADRWHRGRTRNRKRKREERVNSNTQKNRKINEIVADDSLDSDSDSDVLAGEDLHVPHQIHPHAFACSYNFDENGDGNLHTTEISVFCGEYGKDELPHLSSLCHTNILEVMFFDENNSTTIYRRRGASFSDWLAHFSADNEVITTFKFAVVRGGNEKKVVSYIPESVRKIIRGLLAGLLFIHQQNLVVKDLREEHLCFVDDTPKYWGFKLGKLSEDSLMENMRFLESSVRRILEVSHQPIPRDMCKFLELLLSTRSVKASEKLLNHVSLIPPRTRLYMICEMYELKGEVITDEAGGITRNTWWTDAAKKFSALVDVNDWKVKYADKFIGPVEEVYKWKGKSYCTKTGPGITKFWVVEGFINFWKNMVHHLGQIEDKKSTNPLISTKQLTLTREQMDAVIFWAFADEIMIFADCVDKAGGKFVLECF